MRCLEKAVSVLSATVLLGVAGCTRPEPVAKREQRLVVFAAASLREAFSAMGEAFERAHPGVALTFNFAGTQELRTQLDHGAAVDVFASADRRHMEQLVRASRVTKSVVFARNEPVVVVAKESSASIRNFAELPKASRIVVAAPDVPIGRYTVQILERASRTLGEDFGARVRAKIVSRELNARQVLAKVSLGEAQAGFVYRTDARAAQGGVTVLSIAPEANVIAEYPIALVNGASNPELAGEWIEFVLSPVGQRTLRNAGFLVPSTREVEP
jgi:molybdate transport system substrate-binding protein